jgi:S1-C subfamily serine protease
MTLIRPFFVDCVVALGITMPNGSRRWVASGFLYFHVLSRNGDQAFGRAYLVTNRHVVADLDELILRFNPQADGAAKEYALHLRRPDGTQLWTGHPDTSIDVAVIPVDYDLLRREAMQVGAFMSDRDVASIHRLRDEGVSEGDGIFVLGFPMAMVGGIRNSVIVRGGTVARIRDVLAGSGSQFLVDAFVFPGNRGGPVVTKPEAAAISGTSAPTQVFLVGIVSASLTYQERP